MNTNPDQEIITGEQAILTKDAPALAAALDGGWVFPQTCTRGGQGDTDLSLLFQCISWRWKDGWDLLSKRWPEIKSDYRVLRRVLANAWPEVLAQLIPRHFKVDNQQAPSLLVDFMQTIANPNNEYLADQDIGLCVQHIIKHGEDPATVFPGEFEQGDLRLAGHTPWSLAIRSKRWELAEMLAPSATEAPRHPRFEESMDTWFFSAFMRESPLRPEPSALARASLLASGHLMVPWLEESCVLFLEQAWPLLMSLSENDRKAVWEWAAVSGEIGIERLEVLSSGLVDGYANDKPNAIALCQMLVEEGGEPLREAWNRKSGSPALSATDTWDVSVRALSRGKPIPNPFPA